VRLLPAAYVRAYLKRNKIDVADAYALIEVARCAKIRPVRLKSIEQIAHCLADPRSVVPTLLRGTMGLMVEEIRLLEACRCCCRCPAWAC